MQLLLTVCKNAKWWCAWGYRCNTHGCGAMRQPLRVRSAVCPYNVWPACMRMQECILDSPAIDVVSSVAGCAVWCWRCLSAEFQNDIRWACSKVLRCSPCCCPLECKLCFCSLPCVWERLSGCLCRWQTAVPATVWTVIFSLFMFSQGRYFAICKDIEFFA